MKKQDAAATTEEGGVYVLHRDDVDKVGGWAVGLGGDGGSKKKSKKKYKVSRNVTL
jgi:hypothetical protein